MIGKIVLILSVLCVFVGCERDNAELQQLHNELVKQAFDDSVKASRFSRQVAALEPKVSNIMNKIRQGDSLVKVGSSMINGTAVYIIKLRVKTVHHNLSITDAIKDEANAYEFEIPVDKAYFNSLVVGQQLVENSRVGSALINGSFGSDEIHVTNKRIATR